MASLDELGAGNPLDDMDEGDITQVRGTYAFSAHCSARWMRRLTVRRQMCGFRANTPSRSEDWAGGMSEDRVQNAAMAQAMNEIASITSAAVNQCVQPMSLRIPQICARVAGGLAVLCAPLDADRRAACCNTGGPN